MQSITNLEPGTKVRVTFEGIVDNVPGRPSMRRLLVPRDGMRPARVFGESTLRAASSVVVLAPVWQPGDVVVVRYPGNPTAYTYVRGAKTWPGEYAAAKTDAQINALFEEGNVEHVLRDGKPVVKAAKISAGTISADRITAADLAHPFVTSPRPGGRILRSPNGYPF